MLDTTILVPQNTKKRHGMGVYGKICIFSLFTATN